MRQKRNKGFTLTELIVVLAIIAIFLAVAIPSALNYFKLAEFRKNESNAKTVYLAAESALTWYRSNGSWEDFRKEVIHLGTLNQGFGEGDEAKDRIYAVTLNKDAGESSESGKLVEDLLGSLSYDGDFFNASIVIEIDVDTGQVYSAFYGTRCSALKYSRGDEEADREDILEIRNEKRGYEDRRKVLLGYYSVEDVTNVVDIKPVPLKVTSINLVNSETLSLNWSGNSRHDNLDVAYTITFYEKPGGVLSEDKRLFSLTVDLFELREFGWQSGEVASLKLSYPGAGADQTAEGWYFPLTYKEGKFSLILDGMMSARLNALLEAKADPDAMAGSGGSGSADAGVKNQKAFNTSITRLGEEIQALSDLKDPQNIYAVIEGQCTYHGMGDDIREYSPSTPVTSNTENTLYASVEESEVDGASVQKAKITRFRHLSNIRYFDKTKAAEFVVARNLDWTASGGGVYDLVEKNGGTGTGGNGGDGQGGAAEGTGGTGATRYELSWKDVVTGETVLDFPSIPMLSGKHTLTKEGTGSRISNLRLGKDSLANDKWIGKLYQGSADAAQKHSSNYLGLFCELEGHVKDIVFQNPLLVLKGEGTDGEGNPEATEDFAHLYGVGLLGGRCSGSVEGVSVKTARKAGSTGAEQKTVEVSLADRPAGTANQKPAGIGGLIGVLADKEDNGTLKPLTGASGKTISIDHLVMEGTVVGKLPKPDAVTQSAGIALFALEPEADTGDADKIDPVEEAALAYRYGIGGIFGYVWTGEGVDITECQNSADVTGNLFTGGVCGNLTGNFQKSNGNTTGAESLKECGNEGLILCSVKTTDTDGRNIEGMDESLEGRYFGGILGFGNRAWVDESVSASGYRGTVPYTLKENDKDKEKLQGWYVGGILGYGADSLLTGCGTKKDGYILGSDYVGGIAGGLSSNIKEAIKGDPAGVTVTVNESYVIGNRYVGGIVGKNDGTSQTVIQNCVNNGVAAGYDRYIGGIVGYNGRKGTLEDCASYLSDYNHSVYDRIVTDWKAEGDCVGGLAGYNNGEIKFTGENESIVVKSVSSIVVGGSYVGGVIGFNDADGSVEVHYTLIGGEIYGFGDAVGGCIGLNASESLLEQEIRIKPRSIKGRNFVGGMIGANVTALSKDITADKLETDSVLGSIEGDAFVGGLIGYHRTYTQEKLKQAAEAAGMVIRDDNSQIPNVSLLDYLRYGQEMASPEDSAEDTATVDYQDILPRLDGDNLPGDVLGTDDTAFTLTITKASKPTTEDSGETAHKDAWKDDSNNLPIRAYLYVGGIVGYCDKDSRLYLVNCKNVGGISRSTSPVSAGNPSGITDGVSLVKFLEKQQITLTEAEKEEIGDLKVYMVGGMLSANLRNHVIDHCVNKGAMNGFIGLGGIVGFNAGGVFSCRLEDNFGSSELDYIGGIAGLNVGSGTEEPKREYIDYAGKKINYRPGTIADCTTSSGKSVLGRSYVGGIVGYNMRDGMVEDCRSEANVTAVGNAEREIAYVGGIAGCNNGYLAVSRDTGGSRTISASLGVGVGGIAGINQAEGRIYVKSSLSDTTGTGNPDTGNTQPEEIIVVGSENINSENTNVKVTITGWKKVGGIAGINKGRLSARDIGPDAQEGTGTGKDSTPYLTCQVNEISAAFGYAGGIVGEAWGDISRVRNRSVKVTANQGPAGGIVAVNGDEITLLQCQNFGNVNADKGYAGGIAAENYGRIEDCSVGYQPAADGKLPAGAGPLTVNSRGTEAIGGICAVNHAKGDTIEDGTKAAANGVIIASVPLSGVTLSGNAGIVGGIAGINRGIVGSGDPAEKTVMKQMPGINSNASGLTVGGAAGENVHIIPENTGAGESSGTGQEAAAGEKSGTIQNVTAEGLEFVGFTNYIYLGGIAGRNQAGAEVMLCSFSGKITQSTDAKGGNCYGGIAGENRGELSDCVIRSVNIDVKGIYTATGSSTAEQKEALSSHVGGICGKNERYIDENKNVICGRIAGCVIENAGTDDKTKTTITVSNGMAGGVAGYNKGEIELSGDQTAVVAALLKTNPEDGAKISEADTVETAAEMIQKAGNTAMDSNYVGWKEGNPSLESLSYNGGSGVNVNRILSLIMSNNGNVGGITAYNAPTGRVNYCATGNWYLNNKSNAIGVGTGGIIGMNESEQNLSYLLNKAFVGREISKGDTNRFAGGIIGNQNNTTKSEWKIENCANYGTVYCLRTHYSGGILGQWTGTGGTVEHCYNYGNLQTTYEEGWLGAAGGIVAQLYHAYEGDYYNIVSCGNYGNLYGRDGRKREKDIWEKNEFGVWELKRWVIANCANDSAGILGNITAYEAKNEDSAQQFTIQVLDCVNGSGVEIYSTSMASGIVGFVSCDNDDKGENSAGRIAIATSNIVLRVERCRNFAAVLEGGKNQFSAGIFGDRYGGSQGDNKTVIKDCYSVNPQNDRKLKVQEEDTYHYYDKGYPIISYRNTTVTGSKPAAINADRNYFLEDGSDSLNSFVNNKIKDDSSTGDSFTKTAANLVNNNLGRAAANCVYKVQGTSGKYYILYIEPGTEFGAGTSGWPWSAQSWSCEITENGDVLKNKEKIGYVLFNTEKQNFANLEDVVTRHSGIKDNTKVDMDFDYYVRQSYHRIEGAVNGQMPQPKGVKLERTGINKLSIAVDPAAESDPFKYVAILKRGEKVIKEVTFYSNNCTVEVTEEDLQDDITMEVRAYSMYDPDIKPSEPVNPKDYPIVVKILPDPEIRIELTEVTQTQQGTYEVTYLYQLLNQEAYADYKGSYDISVKFMDGTDTLTLYGGQGAFSVQKTDSLQQLIVQAIPNDNAANGLKPSAEVPVPVYLPQAVPSISLKDKEDNGIVNATLSGTNLSDVAITVTLDASKSGNVTTPPVYRVELIGTWESGTAGEVKDVVLASQNILAAANGAASATFTDLSQYDYIVDVKYLRVRVWYAESGQGPVYTWHSVEKDGTTGQPVGTSNITILNGAEKSADVWVPEWSYEYSAVLENDGNGQCFQNYVWTSAEIFTWLDAPKLMEDFPKPEYSETDRKLYYTFKWDENQDTGNYRLSLSGIYRETGEKVAIVTDERLTVNQYSVPAEDWNYSQVELTVTSVGNAEDKKIGQSSTMIYTVASRLPKPGQPVVVNTDVNEMTYRIEWSPITPETGCVSYRIYMRLYGADGKLGEPIDLLEKAVPVDAAGRYVVEGIDLEACLKRANSDTTKVRNAEIYVVAEADAEKPQLGYVNSLPGITYALQIPSRIKTPSVTWTQNWVYNKDQALSPEAFRQNGMTVSVTPQGEDSIPPGGSTYLLAAYVIDYNSGNAADVEKMINEITQTGILPAQTEVPGWLASYPTEDGTEAVPVQMEVDTSQVYSHSLNGLSAEYAGKYILFCTRISSGNGQFSSKWVPSGLIQLPYVKLAEPIVSGDTRTRTVTMTTYTNPDLPEVSAEEVWNANHIAFNWNSVEYADSYYVTITPKDAEENPAVPVNLKILEEIGAAGEKQLKVYQEQAGGTWTELVPETGEDGSLKYSLAYSLEIEGKYEAGGIPIFYKGTFGASVEAEPDGNGGYQYTVVLPDSNDLTTDDGDVITGSDLRNTASVTVRADVQENEAEPGSGAYVSSDPVESLIGN